MKRSRLELSIDVVIHRSILKYNKVALFPCFTILKGFRLFLLRVQWIFISSAKLAIPANFSVLEKFMRYCDSSIEKKKLFILTSCKAVNKAASSFLITDTKGLNSDPFWPSFHIYDYYAPSPPVPSLIPSLKHLLNGCVAWRGADRRKPFLLLGNNATSTTKRQCFEELISRSKSKGQRAGVTGKFLS